MRGLLLAMFSVRRRGWNCLRGLSSSSFVVRRWLTGRKRGRSCLRNVSWAMFSFLRFDFLLPPGLRSLASYRLTREEVVASGGVAVDEFRARVCMTTWHMPATPYSILPGHTFRSMPAAPFSTDTHFDKYLQRQYSPATHFGACLCSPRHHLRHLSLASCFVGDVFCEGTGMELRQLSLASCVVGRWSTCSRGGTAWGLFGKLEHRVDVCVEVWGVTTLTFRRTSQLRSLFRDSSNLGEISFLGVV